MKDMFDNNQDLKIYQHLQKNMMKNTKNADMNQMSQKNNHVEDLFVILSIKNNNGLYNR